MTTIHKHVVTLASEGTGSAAPTRPSLAPLAEQDVASRHRGGRPAGALLPHAVAPAPPALASLRVEAASAVLPPLPAHTARLLSPPDDGQRTLLAAQMQQHAAREQILQQRRALPRPWVDALTPIDAWEIEPEALRSEPAAKLARTPRSVHTSPMGPYSVAGVHEQGRRPTMEDTSAVVWFEEDGLGIAAVFDGHGTAATAQQAAGLIGPVLQAHLCRIPRAKRQQPDVVVAAIKDAFASVDEDRRGARRMWPAMQRRLFAVLQRRQSPPTLHGLLRRRHRSAMAEAAAQPAGLPGGARQAADPAVLALARPSGAAAVVAIFWQNSLYLANLGDSRALLVRDDGTGQRLSKDQKPEDEVAQIARRGGSVAYVEGAFRVDRSVAMSRALGNYKLAVGRRPQVSHVSLLDDHHVAVMLGCDGMFDCLHDDVHAAYIHENLQAGAAPERVATGLVNAGLARDSRDNMSVLLIPLKRGR